MDGGFYQERLARRGIEVITPSPADGEMTHRMVFDELTRGIFTNASREGAHPRHAGAPPGRRADAVVLGCTEFILLVDQSHVPEIPQAGCVTPPNRRVAVDPICQ
jgi:aspartate racemase